MKNIFLYSGFFFLTLFSCKNDVKLNAPYKEYPSIYAVLCPQDKKQMIRVNKVFLGEGDANAMAKVSDSINYNAGELTITLNRFSNGNQVAASPDSSTILFREEIIQTLNGAFSTTQRVYTTDKKLYTNGVYFLTVKNNHTGSVFTATSTAIDSVKPNYKPFLPAYYPAPPPLTPTDESYNFINYSTAAITTVAINFPPNEAAIYQLKLRMHYFDSTEVRDKEYYFVDYDFNIQKLQDKNITTGLLQVTFKSQNLFDVVGNALSKLYLNDVSGRKMYKIQYFIFSTTNDYYDYLQYTTPSFNISQNKPLYSNFDDKAALGIFTFM